MKEEAPSCNLKIYKLLTSKASAKQEIYRKTQSYFDLIKELLIELKSEISNEVCDVDSSLEIEYTEPGGFEVRFQVAGDLIIMYMHTNIFALDSQHFLNKHSRVRKDTLEAYFGGIYFYNFLTDSIKYNRLNDQGVLIGRLMINKSDLFFIEGTRSFGSFENFDEDRPLNREILKEILEKVIINALEIDLTLPAINHVHMSSVSDIESLSHQLRFSTSKKLGFRR